MIWPSKKRTQRKGNQDLLRQLPMTCGLPDLHNAYIEEGFSCRACADVEAIKREERKEDQLAEKIARRVVELMKEQS